MTIDWTLPEHRTGLAGSVDKFIGPGATLAEKILQFSLPIAGAIILIVIANMQQWGWTVWQSTIAAIILLDMLGGIITNATSAAKRWYFREGQSFKAHVSFVAIHFSQLSIVSFFFLNMDVVWVIQTGGFMMLAATLILKTPLYLQRPVAFSIYSISLILSLYIFESPTHLEWFLPFFYFKLLISHCLKEEPYRPVQGK